MTLRGHTVRCGNWGGTVGSNTTELIRHWSMQGAAPDVGDRFQSTADALAIAEDSSEPQSDAAPSALRVRGSDEEQWTPLLLAAGDR